MHSSILLQRSKPYADLIRTRIQIRFMGGGPRTFPGGLNKWQWKRLHEKRARDKERRLLEQEKQLYQARVHSQIRAKLVDPDYDPNSNSGSSNHSPMSPQDHIKALADRFMKEGAEDLWNEKDGPLRTPVPKPKQQPGFVGVGNQRSGSISSPIGLRALVSEQERSGNGYNFVKDREFSTVRRSKFDSMARKRRNFRRNESSSSSDDDSDDGLGSDFEEHFMRSLANRRERVSSSVNGSDFGKNRRVFGESKLRFNRNENDSSDEEEDGDEDKKVRRKKSVKEIASRAALGNYDVKITKRVPLNELEKEYGFDKEVEVIRNELMKRKVAGEEDKSDSGKEEVFLSEKRFDECSISPLTIKALTEASYVSMTRVQEIALPICLEGKDVLVKAKTGTGKSAAFLLPAIETVLKDSCNKNPRVRPVYVLILCPTRELASQLAAEAKALLKYHDGVGVQTLVGGTRFKDDQRRLESDPCQILVATPGRLLDHVESRGGLSVHLMGLKMLVLDEADRLLDLGFRKDIEKIVDCLPRQRQSMLVSATIPKEVRRVSQLVLKREHVFVDTVGLGSVETHPKVKQSVLIVPHELHFQVAHQLLKEHISQAPDYKVVVFCTTAMVTSLVYQLLREMKLNVREIHSRKPQIYRARVSDEFKESKRMILVTSDVSARGVNYPDVTLVIQVGVPTNREEYIHRLGRTGREGKDGEGILLLAPWEECFLDELKDLPLDRLSAPQIDPQSKLKMDDCMSKIDNSIKEAAYHAWLGYYNSIREIGRDKTTLVEQANRFCESIGLQKPPRIFRKTALKMGLKNIPGILIRQ